MLWFIFKMYYFRRCSFQVAGRWFIFFVAVFRTEMRMERQGARLNFRYSQFLRRRCLQVWAALYTMNRKATLHIFKQSNPNIFCTVEPERMDIDTPPLEQSVDNHFLDINSLVEVTLGEGNSYGIIRWIGTLPERKDIMAGLELVILILLYTDEVSIISDGKHLLCVRFCDRSLFLVALSQCKWFPFI